MNLMQTAFNNRTNVAIVITELTNLIKHRKELLMPPHLLLVKINKQ